MENFLGLGVFFCGLLLLLFFFEWRWIYWSRTGKVFFEKCGLEKTQMSHAMPFVSVKDIKKVVLHIK